MRRLIKIFLYTTLALLVVAWVVPFFIPSTKYVVEIQKLVKSQTGRDLEIAGATSFRLLPSIGLRANKVRLSNPPDMQKSPQGEERQFATIERLVFGIHIFPLIFQQKLSIKHIVLHEPSIILRRDKNGRENWVFDIKPSVEKTSQIKTDPAQTTTQSPQDIFGKFILAL